MRRSAIVIQQAVRIWIRERKRSENIELFESHEFLETTASPKTDCIEMYHGENETIPCKDVGISDCIGMYHGENETIACKDVGISIASAAPQCLDETEAPQCLDETEKQIESIIDIQSVARQNLCSWDFQRRHNAAIEIQRIARGCFARKRLLG
jgi:hypothetical protein